MVITAAVVAVVGALVTAGAAVWSWLGFSADNPKYHDDGMLYPGPQRSQVLPALLRDQRRVTSVLAVGGALQLVGTVLALVAAIASTS